MLRYNLDDLGWYQFEWLVQSLLKQDVGLAIESWGGRRDQGRDAYCDSELRFPDRALLSKGPFVFQVKFIEGANAAGARPLGVLTTAVQKEARRIRERITKEEWDPPQQYALLTNSVFDAAERSALREPFAREMPKTNVHLFSGADICDRLDAHEEIRRAFPQLLGLRDLKSLLSDAVNRGLLAKSSVLSAYATRLLPVFVPTRAYEQAWSVLGKHHFAVLEGPPEMGKTAIAHVIALAQLSLGSQALLCDDPDSFFDLYDKSNNQVFVADDAFGRTEYDVTRAKKWEHDLDRVLTLLDKSHWLIWTSRKHILERALHRLDFQGAY